jgi:hypothetical protein
MPPQSQAYRTWAKWLKVVRDKILDFLPPRRCGSIGNKTILVVDYAPDRVDVCRNPPLQTDYVRCYPRASRHPLQSA